MKRWRSSRLTPLTLHPARSEPGLSEPGGLCNHAHVRWDFTPPFYQQNTDAPRGHALACRRARRRAEEDAEVFVCCMWFHKNGAFIVGREKTRRPKDTPEFCSQVIMGCQTRTLDWRRSSVHRSEIQSVDHGCFPQSVKWSLVTCDAVHLCGEAPPSEYKGCGARCSGDACLRSEAP